MARNEKYGTKIYKDNESLDYIFESDVGLIFECSWLPKNKHQWLCDTIGSQLEDIVRASKRYAVQEHKNKIISLLTE